MYKHLFFEKVKRFISFLFHKITTKLYDILITSERTQLIILSLRILFVFNESNKMQFKLFHDATHTKKS